MLPATERVVHDEQQKVKRDERDVSDCRTLHLLVIDLALLHQAPRKKANNSGKENSVLKARNSNNNDTTNTASITPVGIGPKPKNKASQKKRASTKEGGVKRKDAPAGGSGRGNGKQPALNGGDSGVGTSVSLNECMSALPNVYERYHAYMLPPSTIHDYST